MIDLVGRGLLIIQLSTYPHFPRAGIDAEELPLPVRRVAAQGVREFAIGALIRVWGIQLHHQCAWGSVLPKLDAVGGLVEGGRIVVSVQDKHRDRSLLSTLPALSCLVPTTFPGFYQPNFIEEGT